MSTSNPLLVSTGLGYDYGRFQAVGAVDIALRHKTIHSLIGPNGAGKTTFFNIVNGRLRPSRGHLNFAGKDLTHSPAHQRVRQGMARSFQITSLFAQSTVRHNLGLAALGADVRTPHKFWSTWSADMVGHRVETVLHQLDLQAHADKMVSSLSHGLQRVVEIGMCLVPEPQALLLDEPLAGLGLSDIPRISQLLLTLKNDYAILLVEHNMRVVMSISDEITVMFQGNVLATGTPAQVRANADVSRVYLGTST